MDDKKVKDESVRDYFKALMDGTEEEVPVDFSNYTPKDLRRYSEWERHKRQLEQENRERDKRGLLEIEHKLDKDKYLKEDK